MNKEIALLSLLTWVYRQLVVFCLLDMHVDRNESERKYANARANFELLKYEGCSKGHLSIKEAKKSLPSNILHVAVCSSYRVPIRMKENLLDMSNYWFFCIMQITLSII